MRMQIAIRETGVTRDGYRADIAGGVMETSPDDRRVYDECRMPLHVGFRDDGVVSSVVSLRTPTALPDGIGPDLDICSLEDLLVRKIDRFRPNGGLNAEFVFRATDLPPSQHGATVYAFSGFVYPEESERVSYTELCQLGPRGGIAEEAMFFDGIVGEDFRPELGRIDVVEEMRGATMDQLVLKPWWGFGDEPHSLPGTMRRTNYDQIELFQQLHFGERSTVEDQSHYGSLKNRMVMLGMDNMFKDPIFERYIGARRSAPGFLSPYRPIPFSAQFSRKEAVETLVTEILTPFRGM
ncbi:hypothetical protein [Rhizobium sp. BK176]|uniref:hypothetical protein n=1 Tax=Rhizobium sp. BK176 TaxID=2587071 RepID=UPI00216814A4|nr:hypothetical protein [Rhizobium sp. BK176]MCS4089403.1 hypothetical protein [Rhizobium sp. BK176]